MSSLKAFKLQFQPNAYLKSRQSSAKEKCRSDTSWKLFWSQVIVLVVTDELVWVTCSFTALWSCNIHLLHDPAVVLSVWNGLQLSVTIECLSLPHAFPVLSRPVSLPPSVWISTSTSLQADYKGFNVPFTSSMFQVVCACWQNQPWHTHTHANLATLAFIRAAAPVRLALGWAVWHWAHPLMAGCKQLPDQQERTT